MRRLLLPALAKVKATTVVPVLLPQTMPYDGSGRLYASSAARSRAWRLGSGTGPADACPSRS